MGKKTVRDISVAGKRVLVRADLNVPMEDGVITDDTRIRESLPTITYLLEQKAQVIVCSHLGRPKGPDPELSLAPVAGRMGNLLGQEVLFAEDCVGPVAKEAVAVMGHHVLVLENLRFHSEEEKNVPAFAEELASLADIFVNDAFGAAHRAHASTEGVTHYLPSVAGLLMEKEVRYLSALVADPPKPFAAIVGGAKVSTKIAAIEHLLPKLDMLFVGGGMANTFLKATGVNVQMSLVEDEQVEVARTILEKAREQGVAVHLPEDVVAASKFAADAEALTRPVGKVPHGYMILDIGPETLKAYAAALKTARAVVWNGPMGVFEMEKFAAGSFGLARALASLDATTVVGGGETAAVVAQSGLQSRFTHVSTGGGASLEMLEGRELPGVAALMDA
ncbi:MAG: phosphoglycerate kinase [Chloroflexi bacterium]|nr:phosphoglycerate kinase [Dehalococcoidia bacterium]NJD64703.1 phosphoglycerate kinase [Chloroflexota bacterium]PWB45313.1 MAG: phosphoglycerate kinase [Dehalococcoidia bacterium]